MTGAQLLTSDQKRAKFAWERVRDNSKLAGYVNFTKSAPAFIMSNGLMQALAFYQSRNDEAAKAIVGDIIAWLHQQSSKQTGSPSFSSAMQWLYTMPSSRYMQVTREALAMLRWLRQFADALKADDNPTQKAGVQP